MIMANYMESTQIKQGNRVRMAKKRATLENLDK